MSTDTTDVAVLGLGPMGDPIARRLLRTGPITVWNRTHTKADALRPLGAVVADSPAGAARPVTLTVLPDLTQVRELLDRPDGLREGWRRAAVERPTLVIHGTVSPIAVRRLADQLLPDGVDVVDAPVSGGTIGARDGTLSVMVGGPLAALQRLEPVFACYATTIRHFGDIGAGEVAKACNQVVVAATVVAIAESLALARRTGLDQHALLDVLRGGFAGSAVLEQKADKWLTDDYREGGSGRNQLKDLWFAAEAADAAGLRLSVADAVRERFTQMVERGDGDLDHTGVIRAVLGQADT